MEKVTIDGIPIEDYGRNSKTFYANQKYWNNSKDYFMQLGAMQGWQCPICKRVLAPFVQECPCKGQGMETFTTTNTEVNNCENKCKWEQR